jgi:hypothetical protein
MNKLVKPVRELDAAARKKVEEALQSPLADDSEIVYTPAEVNPALQPQEDYPPLPEYYNFYKGLTDEEIDELEKEILRPVRFRILPE